MSQVIKLQNAATPIPEKKTGKLILGATELEGIDAVKKIESLKSYKDGSRALQKVQDLINAGYNVAYDSGTNTVKVIDNLTGNDVTNDTFEYNHVKSDIERNLGATFNSQNHKDRVQLGKLSSISRYGDTKEEEKKKEKKKFDFRSGRTFSYNDKGEYIKGVSNADNEAYIRLFGKYNDEEWDYGSKNDYMKSINDWVHNTEFKDKNGNVILDFIDNLISKMQINQELDDAEIDFLKSTGYSYGIEKDPEKEKAEKLKNAITEAGIDTGKAKQAGYEFGIDEDGNLITTKAIDLNGDAMDGDYVYLIEDEDYLGDYANSYWYGNRFWRPGDINNADSKLYGTSEAQGIRIAADRYNDPNVGGDWLAWNKDFLSSGIRSRGTFANPDNYQIADPTKYYLGNIDEYINEKYHDGAYMIDLSNSYNLSNGQNIYGFISPSQKYQLTDGLTMNHGALFVDKDGTIKEYDNIKDLEKERKLGSKKSGGEKFKQNEYSNLEVRRGPGVWDRGKKLAFQREVGKKGNINSLWVEYNEVGEPETYYLGSKDANGNPSSDIREINKDAIKIVAKKYGVSEDDVFSSNKMIDEIKELSVHKIHWSPINYLFPKATLKAAKTTAADNRKQQAKRYGVQLNRNGGLVPVYQFGGGLDNEKLFQTEDGLTIEESTTDYNKDHRLDGSDGGLTAAEKTQLGATIADMVSMGLAFAPGAGNLVGGAIGFGATTARLAADKAQGASAGEQWKNGIIGYGLDALSLIPVLGGAAKAGKVMKSIAHISKPLIKMLSIWGMVDAIPAVQNIAAGKGTSEDLNKVLRGITAAGGFGMVKANDWKTARVAQKADMARVKSANADFAKPKKFTFGEKDIKVSQKDVNNMLESASGNKKKFAEAFKKKYKVEGEVDEIISSLAGEGMISKEGTKVFGKQITKTEGVKEKDVPSLFRYAHSQRFRTQALGQNYWTGLTKSETDLSTLEGFTGKDLKKYQKLVGSAIKNGKWTKKALEARSILNFAARTPEAFGTTIRGAAKSYSNGFPSPFNSADPGSNPLIYNKKPKRIVVKRTPKPKPTPASTTTATSGTASGATTVARPNQASIEKTRSFIHGLTAEKVGSLGTTPASKTKLWRFNSVPVSNRFQNIFNEFMNRGIAPYFHNSNITYIKRGGAIPKFSFGGKGWLKTLFGSDSNAEGNSYEFNQALGMDTSRMLYALNKQDKFNNKVLEGINSRAISSQMQGYNNLAAPTLDLSPIEHKYSNAKKNLLTPETSDQKLNAAQNMAYGEYNSGLDLQKGAEISQAVGQYNNGLLEYNNAKYKNAVDIANENKNNLGNIVSQYKLTEAQNINDKYEKIVGPYLYQNTQDYKDSLKYMKNYEMQLAQDEYDNGLESIVKTGHDDWVKAWVDSETSLDYMTYMSTIHPDKFVFNQLVDEYKKQNYLPLLEKIAKIQSNSGWIKKNKKGGKNERRPAMEQIAIDLSKSASASSAKYADNLMKLLLKITK